MGTARRAHRDTIATLPTKCTASAKLGTDHQVNGMVELSQDLHGRAGEEGRKSEGAQRGPLGASENVADKVRPLDGKELAAPIEEHSGRTLAVRVSEALDALGGHRAVEVSSIESQKIKGVPERPMHAH